MTIPEMYRVCDSRNEAEGLLMAIFEKFSKHTKITLDDELRKTGLVHRPYFNRRVIRGEVDIHLRKSKADGKFQLFIRCSHDGHMTTVYDALGRRTPRRVEWPPRPID